MIRDFVYEWAWIVFMFAASYAFVTIAHAIHANLSCI